MELSKQIKKYRGSMELSQEKLGEKIYVTRQTISNWENDKSYPEIHSLLLMSTFFGVTLDELIKGALEIMKEEIKTEDIKKFGQLSNVFGVLMIVCVVSIAPLIIYWKVYGAIIAAVLFAVTMYFALKVEKYKKANNIQTYKEILAFMNGEKLDEINQNREEGKRPYQKIMLAVAFGVIGLLAGMFFIWILG
ncbi:MAG: helix-turn-helix transcriptional regulator [Clostridiales bacterium]|nr:helix-turn-helix transcriptional regulator [Clostridiales bacterium]